VTNFLITGELCIVSASSDSGHALPQLDQGQFLKRFAVDL